MSAEMESINLIWVLVSAALVMIMQGGFCFLESGMARAKNSINVAIKNLVDFCIAAMIFWAFGFALMFGASYAGWIGTSHWLLGKTDSPQLLAFFLFQLMFCGTATTIISGAVAERMRFRAYLAVSLLVSGLIYPVFGHWAWNGADAGIAGGWLNGAGFIDFAGSTVVHSIGGWVSLAAVMVIGPRLGRFDANKEIPPHNLPLATFGVILLWFGWFGFNGGSTLAMNASVPLILVNTNLAAAFGGAAALFIAWSIERRPVVAQVMNGVIAGLVAITAGCHVMSPAAAAATGAIGGLVCCFTTYLLPRFKIDDVIGAVPAHAVAGAWGTLAIALLSDPNSWGTGLSRWEQLLVQAEGVGVCFLWAFGFGFSALWLMNKFLPLRVSTEQESAGLNVSEHGASTALLDLVSEMQLQRHEGDFTRRVTVEPHTEVGQIAAEYNRVLDRVNAEILDRETAEQRFRSIFDNALEGIFQTTPEGAYLNANPALARIYGYDSVEALLEAVGDIGTQLYVDPNRRPEFIRLIEEDDLLTDFQSEIRRADGSTIWISEAARAHRDDQGRLLYFEGTVEDITERRRSEQLLREKQEAEAANRAKSAFLASMSHEIRTPLNGVIGMLDLMCGTEMTAQQRRYSEIARSSAGVLLNLINDILDFSKIEAGKLELERIEFDLRDLLEGVPEMFLHRAAEKHLELSLHLVPGTPRRIWGDPERLRQVLVNLVSNAIKFTEKGGVSIRVEREQRGGNGKDRLVFSVQDTGIGIPADRLAKLFHSFSQVDASTTRKYGGTGLGLAICRQLVEAMGGAIEVESRAGEGSRFWFTLPCCESHTVDELESLPNELRALPVLAIDDNPINREILNDQLVQWGAEVTICSEPAEALEALRSAAAAGRPYRIALLDRLLRDADGLELARQIHHDPECGAPRLVLLTSLDPTPEELPRNGIELTVLPKPVRQSRLFDVLVEAARQGASRSDTPSKPCESPRAERLAAANKGEILIADDNEINRMVAAEIVQAAGFRVVFAINGLQAVQAVRRQSFDVVLMDCEMPEMDGFTAVAEIRRLEARGEISSSAGAPLPIIALTAQAVQGDRGRCLAAGMNEYVTKPIHRPTLLMAIADCLASAAQHTTQCPAPVAGDDEDQREEFADGEESRLVRSGAPPKLETVERDRGTAAGQRGEPVELALDSKQLEERCLGNRILAARVTRIFRGDLPHHIEQLSSEIQQRSGEAAGRIAHLLKGAAGNVAAVRLYRIAAQMESKVLAAEWQGAEELLQKFKEEQMAFEQAAGAYLAVLEESSVSQG